MMGFQSPQEKAPVQESGEVQVNRVLSYRLHRKSETPMQAEDALELVVTTGDLSLPEDRALFEDGLKAVAATLKVDTAFAETAKVFWYAPYGNTTLYEDKYGEDDKDDEPVEKSYAAAMGFRVGDFSFDEDGGVDRDENLCGMSKEEFIDRFGK